MGRLLRRARQRLRKGCVRLLWRALEDYGTVYDPFAHHVREGARLPQPGAGGLPPAHPEPPARPRTPLPESYDVRPS